MRSETGQFCKSVSKHRKTTWKIMVWERTSTSFPRKLSCEHDLTCDQRFQWRAQGGANLKQPVVQVWYARAVQHVKSSQDPPPALAKAATEARATEGFAPAGLQLKPIPQARTAVGDLLRLDAQSLGRHPGPNLGPDTEKGVVGLATPLLSKNLRACLKSWW